MTDKRKEQATGAFETRYALEMVILSSANQGMSTSRIAGVVKVSYAVVYQVLRKNGFSHPTLEVFHTFGRFQTRGELEKFCVESAENLILAEDIAEDAGVSRSTVYKVLKKYNIVVGKVIRENHLKIVSDKMARLDTLEEAVSVLTIRIMKLEMQLKQGPES